MNRRQLLKLVTGLAATTVLGAAPAVCAAEDSPEDIVARLYEIHGERAGNPSVFPIWADSDRRFDFFTGGLMWKFDSAVANTPEGDEPPPGADPLYDAQDWDLKSLTVGRAVITGDHAEVPVDFQIFQSPQRNIIRLVQTRRGWRVDDIAYVHPDKTYTLRDELALR